MMRGVSSTGSSPKGEDLRDEGEWVLSKLDEPERREVLDAGSSLEGCMAGERRSQWDSSTLIATLCSYLGNFGHLSTTLKSRRNKR